jgi:hypothetical protein
MSGERGRLCKFGGNFASSPSSFHREERFHNTYQELETIVSKDQTAGHQTAVPRSHSTLWDRVGVVYVSRSQKRRKLTRRAQWALWAFGAGLMVGALVTHLMPGAAQ